MASVDQINLKFDGCFSAGNSKDAAKTVAKTAVEGLLSSLISGGGAAELAASPARGALSTADNAASVQAINNKIQTCTTVVNSLMTLVQQGSVSLQQIMDFINNTVIATIKSNDSQAEKLNSDMEKLTEENKEIMAQIQELGGGDVAELQPDGQDNNATNGINGSNKNGSVATPKFVNHKDNTSKGGKTDNPKLQELLAKYQSNNQQIAMLQTTITALGTSTNQQIQDGMTQQQSSQSTFSSIVSDVQSQATEQFNQLANELKNDIMAGISKQIDHSSNTSNYAQADAKAAAKTASKGLFKSIVGGVLGVATGGAGFAVAGTAATDASDSAAFSAASGLNKGFSTAAKGFQQAIKNLGSSIGRQVATQITQSVNQQLGGDILNLANNIQGIDIQAQSIFDYSKFLNKDNNTGQKEQ